MAALHCTQSAFAGRSVVAGTRAAPRPVAQARSGVIVRAEEAAGTLGGRPDPPSGGERGHWFPGAYPESLMILRSLCDCIAKSPGPAHPVVLTQIGPFTICILTQVRTSPADVCCVPAERQLLTLLRDFAGNEFPPHLDGSMPGDAGFDPLSLGSDPTLLKWCAL